MIDRRSFQRARRTVITRALWKDVQFRVVQFHLVQRRKRARTGNSKSSFPTLAQSFFFLSSSSYGKRLAPLGDKKGMGKVTVLGKGDSEIV